MAKRRRFTPQFKAEVVIEALMGQSSQAELCRKHNLSADQSSLAHRGRPWDNGYAQRLIRTLKEEEVYLNEYDDIIDARTRIEQFILQVYNHKRPHSALGYLTPVEFERQYLD